MLLISIYPSSSSFCCKYRSVFTRCPGVKEERFDRVREQKEEDENRKKIRGDKSRLRSKKVYLRFSDLKGTTSILQLRQINMSTLARHFLPKGVWRPSFFFLFLSFFAPFLFWLRKMTQKKKIVSHFLCSITLNIKRIQKFPKI